MPIKYLKKKIRKSLHITDGLMVVGGSGCRQIERRAEEYDVYGWQNWDYCFSSEIVLSLVCDVYTSVRPSLMDE